MDDNSLELIPIPDQINLLGLIYRVEANSPVTDPLTGDTVTGHIDFDAFVIEIDNDFPLQTQWLTFLHECLHGIFEHCRLNMMDEEVVDVIARSLLSFLANNNLMSGIHSLALPAAVEQVDKEKGR